MNKLIFAVAAAVAVSSLFAAEAESKTKTSGADRRAAREKRIAAEGGMLVKPYAGKYVTIVNDQKRVAEKDFFKENQSIAELFDFPVKIVPPKSDVRDSAIVITLSDNTQAPALLVAPEVPWAGVNIGALAADKPSDEVLVSRLQKEIWRAFMYVCGAANSRMQPCVMRPVFNVKDLDFHKVAVPCPESLPRVMTTARALEIGETARCTYRQACIEGWAPKPTNDVQKAIYREFKK